MTTFEIFTIVFGSGITLGVLRLIFMGGKIIKTIETMQEDIRLIKKDLQMIEMRIDSIDGRLNRLEGAFFERGQWEARSYKMVKSKPGDK